MATQREIAMHLDLSQSAVSDLAKSGVIAQAAERGGYDVDACRLAYIRHLRSKASGRGGEKASNLEVERLRLAAAKADQAEMRNAETRCELLPRIHVNAAVQGAFARVRARLLAIPVKAAPVLAAIRDKNAIKAKLDESIFEALRELSATPVEVAGGGPADD